MAFYVKDKGGAMTTFLRKQDAEKYAGKIGGTVIGFEEAVASISS